MRAHSEQPETFASSSPSPGPRWAGKSRSTWCVSRIVANAPKMEPVFEVGISEHPQPSLLTSWAP